MRIKNTLGIDIGGSSIKAGFLPGPRRRCLHFKARPTPKTTQAAWELLIDIIIDYCARYLPFKNFPFKQFLEQETLLPITIDNDANVFTLAEAILGAGKKYQNVIGLTLGTGVGGGIVINKKIYHGRGNAGELGYLLQNQSGPRGQLGENGALQEFIRAGVLIKNKKITVAALAREHNPRANKIWQEFGSHLGYALASISHIFDPDVIILGGQIAKAWPRFYSSLQKSLNKNCILPKTPIIKRAALGDSAGVIGAALLANLPYANS
ncbi:MAG: Sugar kinase [Parcubacteria group bacterium GW2011_GWF1_43_9]|nr:MAG: Sugar kinase [Parcubacteria group bacterium GW2011_GWF1_43_9]